MQRITVFKLHELIKSLKKGEKRSFKLFTKKYSKNKEAFYIQVFDYLDKVELVDREKFKKKFQAVKGLSGIQQHLYNQILKSLKLQKTQNNIDSILIEGLGDIGVLREKGLIHAAKEKLEDLLNLAQLHDQIFYVPILYHWWFSLETSKFHYRDVELSTLDENIKKFRASVAILDKYQMYQTNTGRMMFYLMEQNSRQVWDIAVDMDKTLPAYAMTAEATSLSVIVVELQLRRLLMAVLRQPQRIYQYARQLTSVLKQYPEAVLETYQPYYHAALMSQMTYAPTVEAVIPILEEMKNSSMCVTNNLSLVIILTEMDVYLTTGQLEASYQYMVEQTPVIESLKKTIPPSNFGIWYYKIAIYYYATQNYAVALKTIDEYLDNKNIDQIIKYFALLLKIIIYYEEEEYILLASFLNNFRRHLRKNENLLFFEKTLISLMVKLIKTPKIEHKPLLINFKKELIEYLKKAANHEKEMLTYFNYIEWLDNQISQTPFRQLYFRHVGNISF
ncbi:hypothetical protein [Aureispira sp. CCB-QB1]|uniref:hypothetical protein n=1 Tax=Aureispira sp. CCB-QB1 TaxID=1313421 RepID=UPI000698F15B|nr:hypothetical protein [Aureispira sp. CCB-QB1]